MKVLPMLIAAALAVPGPAFAQELVQAAQDSKNAVGAKTPEDASLQAQKALEGGVDSTKAVKVADLPSLGSKPAAPAGQQTTVIKDPAGTVDIGMPEPEQPGQPQPGNGNGGAQQPAKRPSGGVRLFKGLGMGFVGLISGPFLYGAAAVLWTKSKADEHDNKAWNLLMPFTFIGGFIAGIFMGPYKGFKEEWDKK